MTSSRQALEYKSVRQFGRSTARFDRIGLPLAWRYPGPILPSRPATMWWLIVTVSCGNAPIANANMTSQDDSCGNAGDVGSKADGGNMEDISCPSCQLTGNCVPTPGTHCRAVSGTCHRSQHCVELGLCRVLDGLCDVVATPNIPCPQTFACKVSGSCSEKGSSQCRASSDQECKTSWSCTEFGNCKFSGKYCVPNSDTDCQASTGCSLYGRCHRVIVDGVPWCRPTGASDCKNTEACLTTGACVFAEEAGLAVGGHCVVPNGTSCAASEGCAKHGWCELFAGRCHVTSHAHCADSKDCRETGKCYYSITWGCVHPSVLNFKAAEQ